MSRGVSTKTPERVAEAKRLREVEGLKLKDIAARVEFIAGRLRFIKHGHDRVEPNQRPPFGCCLLIWGAGA